MIGSSLSLCYPRIGVVDLFYLYASCSFMPLDKTYPTSGSLSDLQAFSHFGFILASSRVHTRPLAGNASRWHALPKFVVLRVTRF